MTVLSNIDVRITGKLTALSPINIVPPNTEVVNLPGGGKAVMLATLPVVRESGEAVTVPVITASTIRGKLRRAAATVCLQMASEKPGLRPYLYSVIGAVKGSEKEDVYSISDRDMRRQRNPVVALFGASLPWDSSRAYVGNAIPVDNIQPHLVTGTRTDDFVRNSDISEIVDSDSFDDYLQVRENVKATSGAKADVKKLLEDRRKAKAEGRIADVEVLDSKIREARVAAEESAAKSGNSIQIPFSHFVIAPGTVFDQQTILRGVSAAEVGLYLLALEEAFSVDPHFGGKRNHGYGLLRAEWNVSVRDRSAGRSRWKDIGTITASPYEEIEFPSELEQFIDGWNAYVEKGDMNMLLEGVDAPVETSEAGKSKSKKKAEAVE